MLLRFYSLLVLIIVFYSCKSDPEKVSEVGILMLELDDAELLDTDKFEILELIPLETNQSNLMGLDLRVREAKDGFFIMDIGMRDAVYEFSSEGNYLGSVASVGEGPGQFMGLQDFQVDADGNLFVLSSLGDQTKIIKINSAGELVTVLETDYLAGSFTMPSFGEFLLAGGYNLPIVKDRVVLMDSSGVIQSTFLPNDYENEMLPMGERNFYESGENLLYTEIFNDRVYKYSEAVLNPVLEIDMGKYALPDDFWEVDLMDGFGRLQENGFATFKAVFEDEAHYLVNIHIQGKEGSYKKLLLINKENGNSRYWDGISSEEELYSDPIAMENGKLTFLTYHSVLKKKLGGNLPANIEEKKYDYPVLVTIKIDE